MISNVTVVPCKESSFVKPKRIEYLQSGISKIWDIVEVHDSVAILLYHEEHGYKFLTQNTPKFRV